MFSLAQSLYIKGSAGNPLPTVWESLTKKGTRLLRGQLVLVCAGPGAGKSALTLTYALRSGVPTLYFSADSDAFTQLTRSISILTGWDTERSARAVRAERLGDVAEQLDNIPIRFNYKASPSLDQIEDTIRAYDALYEDYPALIVVDNVTNVRTDSGDDDPFAGLEALMDYLHEMARETGACVIGLHHVNAAYNDSEKPIPMSGIKGQIGRVPEMVLTLHRVASQFGEADALNVSTVKNRAGKQDPSGREFVSLDFAGDTMTISDPD